MIKENETVNTKTSTALVDVLIEAVQDRKAKDIVLLDLRNIDEATADFYIICQGTSTTHVSSIAENVIDHAYVESNERPITKSGLRVGEWALVDFFNVVVHIFIEPVREKYALEDLWGDAVIKKLEDLN